MPIPKHNLYRLGFAVFVIAATTALAFFPWTPAPPNTTQKTSFNVASADVANWASQTINNNFDCPLAAVNATEERYPRVSGPRTRAFVTAALDQIRAPATMRERILVAAELAIKCRIFFGNCGRSAGTLYALAGVEDGRLTPPSPGDLGCIVEEGGCNLRMLPRRGGLENEIMGLSSEQEELIRGRSCSSESPPRRNDCFSGGLATVNVRNELKASMQRAGKPDYPNRWADHLLPGDWLYIYNGNSTPIGSHSVIFLGWENEAIGSAWIYEGNPRSWEPEADYRTRIAEMRVRINTMCLKTGQSSCLPVYPIVKVFSPPGE